MARLVNPFQSQQFHVPQARHDFLRSLSAQQGGDDPGRVAGSDIPFPRMVDAWLLAVAIGRADGAFTRVGAGGVELKAVTALNVLNSHQGAVAFLMHVAVAHEGDAYVVQDPGKVVQIADGYAVSGFESIHEMIGSGSTGSRVLNLSRALTERYAGTAGAAKPKLPEAGQN
jgi:hypothetical protein